MHQHVGALIISESDKKSDLLLSYNNMIFEMFFSIN